MVFAQPLPNILFCPPNPGLVAGPGFGSRRRGLPSWSSSWDGGQRLTVAPKLAHMRLRPDYRQTEEPLLLRYITPVYPRLLVVTITRLNEDALIHLLHPHGDPLGKRFLDEHEIAVRRVF